MDRSRRRRTSSASTMSAAGGGEEELALVKAAAWAWYQRGSGYEGRAARESDLVRQGGRACVGRPSRYKLEALATVVVSEALKPRPDPVTLLDVYEVGRITKDLDRFATSGAHDRMREAARRKGAARKNAAAARSGTVGFLGRHAMGICGVGGGVVDASHGLRRRKAAAAVSPAMATVV